MLSWHFVCLLRISILQGLSHVTACLWVAAKARVVCYLVGLARFMRWATKSLPGLSRSGIHVDVVKSAL